MQNNNSPELSIRVDKKQLINQLRAMTDNIIEIWIDPKNLRFVTLKDRYNVNNMSTRN